MTAPIAKGDLDRIRRTFTGGFFLWPRVTRRVVDLVDDYRHLQELLCLACPRQRPEWLSASEYADIVTTVQEIRGMQS